jgi:hypothetical protein
MADFATLTAAEVRLTAKLADHTWVNGYACRATTGGKFAVRVQRPMSPTHPGYGEYVEITDDAAV